MIDRYIDSDYLGALVLFESMDILLVFSAALPHVRNLWVSNSFPAMNGLVVQWKNPSVLPSVPPISHFAVQWRSETRPPTGCWTTVDSFNISTVIKGAALLEYSASHVFSV